MEAEIKLEYDGVKYAESVAKAVSPDNFKVPSGLSVKTENREKTVVTYIKCDMKISTLLATLDDLLSCITTAEETIRTTKRLE